jgi:hypothetical protein
MRPATGCRSGSRADRNEAGQTDDANGHDLVSQAQMKSLAHRELYS